MNERIILSGDHALRELRADSGQMLRRIELSGSGALAASGEALFAAGDGGHVIWRLDKKALIPTGLFAGGPDVCALLLSPDEKRLYVLCAEADSLLMLDAETGMPLMLNRAGVAPNEMAFANHGRNIVVAGGACGEVLMFDAQTLRMTQRMQTAGAVFSVLAVAGCIYALSLDDTLNTVFTVFRAGEKRSAMLSGMPGSLALLGGRIAAATHEGIYIMKAGSTALEGLYQAPGRAKRLMVGGSGLWMTDMWEEKLLCQKALGDWRFAAEHVKDALMLPTDV